MAATDFSIASALTLLGTFSIAFSNGSIAGPDPNQSDKPEKIEVTAGQEINERKEDTATKIIISSPEIMKFGDTQLLDVLKRLPGITVQGNSVRMRGLGNGYTQILIDGERVSSGFSIDQLSPASIERIEILRAATAEFSTQSIAGTVNFVLKRKVAASRRELRLAYGYGRLNTAQNANFGVSGKDGEFSFLVNGYVFRNTSDVTSQTKETGPSAAAEEISFRRSVGRADIATTGIGLTPRMVWNFQSGDSVVWQSIINANRTVNAGDVQYLEVKGASPSYSSYQSRTTSESNFSKSDVAWTQLLEEGAKFDLKVGGYYGDSRIHLFGTSFNSGGVQNLERTRRIAAIDAGLSTTGRYSATLVSGHALVAGWDLSANRRDDHTVQIDQPNPGIVPAIRALRSDIGYVASVFKTAFYGQDEWNITESWSTYLGARWESILTSSTGDGFSRITNRSAVLSPIAQSLYRLPGRKGEQIRVAVTRTYKSPVTPQLIPIRISSIDNRPTDPDTQGNPDLRPELATGIDLAAEKFWEQGGFMSVSLSARRIVDYTRQGLRVIDGRWVQLPVNDGTANTRSLEFDAKLPLQRFIPDSANIDFRINLNRNWSRVDSVPGPRNFLDGQNQFGGTVGLEYRTSDADVSMGGSFSLRSGGEVRTSATQSSYQSTKRELDIFVLKKVSRDAQIRVSITNLLGQSSVAATSYVDAVGKSALETVTPSRAIVRLGVELRL
jgi:outer membrane receptor for ferrienterochelin and colicins